MPSDPDNFPFVLIGNKIDLKDQRLISSSFAYEWCKTKKNMSYFETSVKEEINVDEAFKEGTMRAFRREKENKSCYDDVPNQIKIDPSSITDEYEREQQEQMRNMRQSKFSYCGC